MGNSDDDFDRKIETSGLALSCLVCVGLVLAPVALVVALL